MHLLYISTTAVCAILPTIVTAAAILQIDDGLGAELADNLNTGFSSSIPIATITQPPIVHTSIRNTTNHQSTAAAVPQIDDGLGAQLADDLNTGFSSAVPVATLVQSPIVQTSITNFTNHRETPPVQHVKSQAVKSNFSQLIPTATGIQQSRPSATSPTAQDNSLQAQSPDAINHIFDTSTNTTSVTIPIAANSTSPPPPIQDNGLLTQDINPIDTAFASSDNSTINTNPQPVNESNIQAQIAPSNPGTAKPSNPTSTPHPSHAPTKLPPNSFPSNTTPPSFPQDNGLQAQDVSGENDDFSPQTNQTAVNYPHQYHDPQTDELVVPVVQDNGLQAQDSGAANVDWSPGETYDGGLGGDINVPTAVNGAPVEQTKRMRRR